MELLTILVPYLKVRILNACKERQVAEATLTSKGQVTIPKIVRDAMGLKEGDRVDFIETDKGMLMVPATRDLKTLRGMFKNRRARAATIAEIKKTIGEMGE